MLFHEVNFMARQQRELKYIELKSGYQDDGPAWIGWALPSKSGKMLYFNDHAFLRCIGISGNYYDVETGDEYWISSVKKNGQDRHWAGNGKIRVAQDAVDAYLAATGSAELNSKKFYVSEIAEQYPVERINALMNGVEQN
jgi:hypothetical protein